ATGSSQDVGDICTPGGGSSTFVNLESSGSLRFLRSVPGVVLLSAKLIDFESAITTARDDAVALQNETDLFQLVQDTRTVLLELSRSRRNADSARSATLRSAIFALEGVHRAKTLADAETIVATAIPYLDTLVAQGPN